MAVIIQLCSILLIIPTDENCDLSTVQTLRKLTRLPVAHKWRELGLELGVPVSELNIIQENNQGAVDPCRKNLADMFEWWIDNQKDASYGMVEEALWILKKRTFRRYGAAIIVCMYMEHAAISNYVQMPCNYVVSQTRPNQPQRRSLSVRDTESDPRWGWLGLACETSNYECSKKLCIILIVLNDLHAAVHGYMHYKCGYLFFVCKHRSALTADALEFHFIAGLLAIATLVTVFPFLFKSGNFVLKF